MIGNSATYGKWLEGHPTTRARHLVNYLRSNESAFCAKND